MRGLRTLVSALAVVVGATLIATWAVSWLTIKAVEDGTAVSGIAARALDSPEVTNRLSSQIGDTVVAQVADRGLDVGSVGLEEPLRGAIDSAVRSDAFAEEMTAQVKAAGDQFADQLTDALREPAPLVIDFDASAVVNDRLENVPAVDAAVPDVMVPVVPIEVLDADTFEDVRSGYDAMEFAKQWFLWAGLALIVLGLAVSHRRRWFLAKFLAAVGVLSIGVWLLLETLEPGTIASWMPGGGDGSVGQMITEIVTAESIPGVAQWMLWFGVGSLFGAGIAAVVGTAMGPRR